MHAAWTVSEYDQAVKVLEKNRANVLDDIVSVNKAWDDEYSNDESSDESDTSSESDCEMEDDIDLHGLKHKCPLNEICLLYTSPSPRDS